MSLSKLGLRAASIMALVNRLSSGTLGRENIGSQLDAMTTGVLISFNNQFLNINPQAVAGTQVRQRLLTDTIGSIASPTEYFVVGAKNPWRLTAGDANTGGVAATSGLVPYSSSYPLVRGSLLMQLGDINGASSIVLDQSNLGNLPGRLTSKKNAWDVVFEIADWTNRTSLRTVVLAELGIAFGATSNDPAAAFSASDFAVFELSQNQIRFVGTGYTGAFVQAPPTADFELSISYNAEVGLVTGYLNGKQIGQLTLTSAGTAQIGVRAMHRTAYTAATALHQPIGLRIDSILANIPIVEG